MVSWFDVICEGALALSDNVDMVELAVSDAMAPTGTAISSVCRTVVKCSSALLNFPVVQRLVGCSVQMYQCVAHVGQPICFQY